MKWKGKFEIFTVRQTREKKMKIKRNTRIHNKTWAIFVYYSGIPFWLRPNIHLLLQALVPAIDTDVTACYRNIQRYNCCYSLLLTILLTVWHMFACTCAISNIQLSNDTDFCWQLWPINSKTFSNPKNSNAGKKKIKNFHTAEIVNFIGLFLLH